MIRRLLVCLVAVSLSCSSSDSKPNPGSGGSNGAAGSSGQGQAGSTGNAGSPAQGQAGSSGSAGSTSQGQAGTGVGGAGPAGSGAAGNGAAGTGAAGTGAAGSGLGGSFPLTGAGGTTVTSACGKLLPLQTDASVLQRGENSQRTAHFVVPALTTAAVSSMKFGPDAAFNTAAKFMGNLEGVPLFLAGSAPGKGTYFVASHTGNSYITAIDETTGATLWSHNMGPSGSGVRSTPVIDAATGTIYAAFDATTGSTHFEIHALSIANMGAEVTTPAGVWPVNASNVKSVDNVSLGSLPLGREIQRGALSLVNGILYVPFGGVFGDQPTDYKGFVVAVDTKTPTNTGGWAATGDRSGLWQSGGLASDGTSVFAATSNGSANPHADSEEIIRITGMGASTHAGKDVFFPSYWNNLDAHDNDFGSSSPQVLQFSAAACQSLVVAPSKPGHLYFLDPNNLGGADGSTPFRDMLLGTGSAPPLGGEYKVFYAAPTAYISAGGVHVALEARVDAKCPNGSGDQLVSIKLDMTTTPPTPSVDWCQPVQGGEDRHSAISTSINGLDSSIVWFVVNGALKAFDGDKGTPLFTGGTCGNFEKQTAPIAADGHVVIGADGRLCSYSVQP
jgi:hypothetical protein